MYVNVSCKAWSFARNSNMTNCPKWPNLSSDRRFYMSRICFAVFCRKLRISTLTYCRHLDIGTHPPGMALLKTARFRLDRLHIRLGRFRSCLHKWIMAPSAAWLLVAQKNRSLTMLSFTVQSIGHRPLHTLTILDGDNRMAAQHLPRDLVRSISGL